MRALAGQMRGYTMIELVCVLVVVGILAVVVMLNMSSMDTQGVAFHDKSVAALRYAQKTATSHRRTVCVSFDANSMSLTIATTHGSNSCDVALPIPGASGNRIDSGSASLVYTAPPSSMAFYADGTSDSLLLAIPGQAVINVVGTTGYVD